MTSWQGVWPLSHQISGEEEEEEEQRELGSVCADL